MTERESKIEGLRAMADFFGANPDVNMPALDSIYIWLNPSGVRSHARALKTFRKEYDGTDFFLVKEFHGITLKWMTSREAVCKKVVTGYKEVPEMIIAAKPEQLVPASEEKIIPAHKEEITDWICSETALLEDAPAEESAQSEEVIF